MERARAHYCTSDGPLAALGGGSAGGLKSNPPVDVIYNSLVSAHKSMWKESLLEYRNIKHACSQAQDSDLTSTNGFPIFISCLAGISGTSEQVWS